MVGPVVVPVATRVAVIGAGAAGLVCARELDRVGIEPVVFEASDQIGGTWVYRDPIEDDPLGRLPSKRIRGSMYASLRTNLPTDLMAFRDFPFDARGGGEDGWSRFPGHAEVLTYLRRFARHFGLHRVIRLESAVEWVAPVADGRNRWRLSYRCATGPNGLSEEAFDGVAVCNGHYTVPRVPDLPGLAEFGGRILHSHNYREPSSFAGRRVALLGAKSSGIDLSREIGEVATEIHLCARECPPSAAPGRRGNIRIRPPIARLRADGCVELTDGNRIAGVDDLVVCTGYHYHFPFFGQGHDLFEVEDDWVTPLWLELIAIRAPTLALIGLPYQVVPFPQIEIQSRFFAHLMAGRIPPPDLQQMLAEHRSMTRQLSDAGLPRRHFLRHGERQFPYYDDLAQRVGSSPLPSWFADLYRQSSEAKRKDPDRYRDLPLPGPFDS